MSIKQIENKTETNQSRRERRKAQKHQTKEQPTPRVTKREEQKIKRKEQKGKNRKPRRRMFPIWLRVFVVLIFSACILLVGAMVGYGIIGDGVPKDALKIETWQHIIDIVKKK